jgi:hypothetical protein
MDSIPLQREVKQTASLLLSLEGVEVEPSARGPQEDEKEKRMGN